MERQNKWTKLVDDDQKMCEYGNGIEADFTCNTCSQSERSVYGKQKNRAHWRCEVKAMEGGPDYLCDVHYDMLLAKTAIVVTTDWVSADEFASGLVTN